MTEINIDGVPDVFNDPDYVNRIGNAIAGINPKDIERIDVLKDAAATALYGTRAANGSLRYYRKSAGQDWFNYNILNEMRQNRTEQRVSSATTLANLRYKPTKDLSVNAIVSATTQSSRRETWHGEESFYASALRLGEAGTLPPANSAMPFGGELENQGTQSLNWTARLQANWNKYLGRGWQAQPEHQWRF